MLARPIRSPASIDARSHAVIHTRHLMILCFFARFLRSIGVGSTPDG
jgi:hypothetical protein